MLLDGLDREDREDEPILVPDPDIGMSSSGVPPCMMETYNRAMRPADQQMLTRLALYTFLEREFADSLDRRRQMDRYLAEGITAENPAVRTLHSALDE